MAGMTGPSNHQKPAAQTAESTTSAEPSGLLLSIRPYPRTYDMDDKRAEAVDIVVQRDRES